MRTIVSLLFVLCCVGVSNAQQQEFVSVRTLDSILSDYYANMNALCQSTASPQKKDAAEHSIRYILSADPFPTNLYLEMRPDRGVYTSNDPVDVLFDMAKNDSIHHWEYQIRHFSAKNIPLGSVSHGSEVYKTAKLMVDVTCYSMKKGYESWLIPQNDRHKPYRSVNKTIECFTFVMIKPDVWRILKTEPADRLTVTVGTVSFKMVYVAAGTFTMGATPEQQNPIDSEKPAHRVTLTDDYYMGETEVTQALWREVMGESLLQIIARNGWNCHGVGDDYPMYVVSYDDCQEFIRRLNARTGRHFRLPTEAEWEFAARGGNKSRGYQYAGSDNLDDVAWYEDNSDDETHPVKAKRPNELGLYDMSGNVWEWCQDYYGDYCSASQTNPTGPNSASYCVFRGGCWDDGAWKCRVANRNGGMPVFSFLNLGLRLALSE